jgi:uncharacterized protein (TIGR02453 family)
MPRVWPRSSLEFLTELETNNDSDWFRANRDRYEKVLVEPGRQVAAAFAHLGHPHFFRPYNNLRFRPGPPLKENFAIAIGYGGGGGYYFDLSLDGLLVAAGIHNPASDQLERYRAAIDNDRLGRRFELAIRRAEAGGLEPAPPELKRAPKGYPIDHPRIELLRMKELTVFRRHKLGAWLHDRRCIERLRTEFDAARPFVKWLGEYVGPSQQPRR